MIAEAGRQACGVGLASAQKHPVGEERPGSVADLIDGSRHLATLGVDEREGAAVHTPHRPREERLDHGVLKHAGGSGRRIGSCHARRNVVDACLVDLNHPVSNLHRHGRCAFDHGRLDRWLAAVARATEHARLEHEVAIRIGQIAEELLCHDRLNRLVVDRGGDGHRSCSARRDHDRISIERHRGAGVRQRPQPRVAQERIVVQVAVPVEVAELRQRAGIVPIDHAAPCIDREALAVGHQIQRRGVDQIERRAAVALARDRPEQVGERIGRAGRNLPVAAREIGIDHILAGQAANPGRGAFPERIVDRQLTAGREIDGANRQPRHATLREAGWKIVAGAAVGDLDLQRRAAARRGVPRPGHVQVQDVA